MGVVDGEIYFLLTNKNNKNNKMTTEEHMKFSFLIPNDFQFQLKRYKKKKGGEGETGGGRGEEGEGRYREVEKGKALLPPRFCQTKFFFSFFFFYCS